MDLFREANENLSLALLRYHKYHNHHLWFAPILRIGDYIFL